MTQDTPMANTTLYHFCASVYELNSQTGIMDGMIETPTITCIEDYNEIKKLIHKQHNLKESENIMITSLTKLS